MIGTYSFTGSFGFVVPLWILTGALILVLDVNSCRERSLIKESKVFRALGWINIAIGLALLIVRWTVVQV